MATQYFGDSFYKESLLVRCACKEHMIEIFAYDGPENMEYGITCITPCNRRVKRGMHPDFYFKGFKAFNEFVQYMHKIKDGGSFTIKSVLNDCINGCLLINNDGNGYIDIVRYMTETDKNKNKCMWDIYLELGSFSEFLKELDKLLNKSIKFEIEHARQRSVIYA